MYNRGSCTWPVSRIFHVQLFFMYINESRIFYVQPFSHVHDHNQEWFLYINYVQPCFQGLVQLKYVHKSWKTSAKWPELASTRLNTPHIWPKKSGASRLTFSVHMTKNPDAGVHSSYYWNTKVWSERSYRVDVKHHLQMYFTRDNKNNSKTRFFSKKSKNDLCSTEFLNLGLLCSILTSKLVLMTNYVRQKTEFLSYANPCPECVLLTLL